MPIRIRIRIFSSMRIPIRFFHFDADFDQDSKDDVDPRGSRSAMLMRIQSKNVKKIVFEDVLMDLI
jgi:hypothetical protein